MLPVLWRPVLGGNEVKMQKRLIGLLGIVLAVGLAACNTPAPTATAAPTPTLAPTSTPLPTATPSPTPATKPSATATPTTAETGSSPATPAGWQIPGIRGDDWAKGPESAGLVIVEYSDFQ